MNRTACLPLALSLRRAGFVPYRFGYPSLRDGLSDNAARLGDFVDRLTEAEVNLVGHSLGGLIILQALSERLLPKAHRVVLLGSPVQGSLVADQLVRNLRSRWLIGACLPAWNAKPIVNCPATIGIGVIAGSVRIGMATLFSRNLPRPNDGAVSVAETRLAGALHLNLRVSHTGLLLSPKVMRQTADFLKNGHFSSPDG